MRVRSLTANTHHDSLLAFSTAKGVVGAWDTRSQRDGWTMNSPPGHGLMKVRLVEGEKGWCVRYIDVAVKVEYYHMALNRSGSPYRHTRTHTPHTRIRAFSYVCTSGPIPHNLLCPPL